ncbi:alpha/beta hydrolase fold domain-containing protein [Massilia sp. Leaf139]|uniref:alpha/beta hydrolase fold domain-containing protein n=1 Tax=Massilia sp. Leaf139 TaxID=1736272 RepID=UPI0006F25096|nr:alpha/beta hydrolase fold domain-containing protein [Massilia sp. Leaf139]KQQ97337.1 esterase [Massilia sp. Leaf139]
MTKIVLDDAALQAVLRFNARLARLPRFRIRNRFTPAVAQWLLRAGQLGADGRLARRGIRVERHWAAIDGLRVPLRVLRPAGPVKGVVLDIHGGGWVIGNARMDDRLNAALAAACQVAVASVDYRLLPRVALQGAMDDCLAAARWLLGPGLREFAELPLFILGESAGAHLAATVLLRLKAAAPLPQRIAGAVLYYGVYDLGGSPSVRAAGPETLVLDGPGMVGALRMLTPECGDTERRQAPCSPLYGDLSGLPPALLFAGERDPLRDDSLLMAARWNESGDAELQLLPEAPHGFLHFPTPLSALAQARTHAWIRACIAAWECSTVRSTA